VQEAATRAPLGGDLRRRPVRIALQAAADRALGAPPDRPAVDR
jgi:hypothetical protein